MLQALQEDSGDIKRTLKLHTNKITELEKKAEHTERELKFVSGQEETHHKETSDTLATIDERLAELESLSQGHSEKLNGQEKLLDGLRRDYDEMSSLSAPKGGVGSAKAIEMANKLREVEARTKELEMKFESFDVVTQDQIKKLNSFKDKVELDSQNALALSQTNRERLDEMVKNVRTI